MGEAVLIEARPNTVLPLKSMVKDISCFLDFCLSETPAKAKCSE
jgi:hypothetical protein